MENKKKLIIECVKIFLIGSIYQVGLAFINMFKLTGFIANAIALFTICLTLVLLLKKIQKTTVDDWTKALKMNYWIVAKYTIFLVILQIIAFLLQPSGSSDQGMLSVMPVYFFFAAIVIAPITEEIIFRDILLVKVFKNKWFSLVFTTLLFCLLHEPSTTVDFFVYLGTGLLLAFERKEAGAVKYTILTHSLMNSIVILISFF